MTLQSDFKFDHDLEMEIMFADPTKLMVAYEEGSMGGKNILQAKESLLLFLKSLPTNCRFQIVGFGSTFSALFDEPRDYTEESIQTALEYQKHLDADMGGTEVLGALESIYAKEITGSVNAWVEYQIFNRGGRIGHKAADCLTSILCMSFDGFRRNQPPTLEVISLVRHNAKTTRLFAIGLGDGVSTSLVTGVARAGGGKSAFVRNEERLQPVVLQILQLALQPFATDVELTWSITGDAKGDVMPVITIPDQLPNIYSGSYATVVGLIENRECCLPYEHT
ncbi:unnamed protein product [Dibothriocephalus latus]|uniref:VWFA domain-containing protein n=1 Tax=Dibothriocephalus latus TaxID=60516 RepID=A0A3P7LP35_DIBLA|nr:unnamed protein product [Dibothriocephalus latus]